jgi:hypothetical protein
VEEANMIDKLLSRFGGSERVGGGVYWSHRDGGFMSIPREGAALPGQTADRYTRVPILLVLIAGPILGTAFALFLPAAAIVGLGQVLLGRIASQRVPARARRELAGADAIADLQL